MSMNDILEKAKEYKRNSDKSAIAHYMMWELLSRRHVVLGAIAITSATVVGTTIFATLQGSPAIHLRICAGMVSLLAAVLSALQTFLNLAEAADTHKLAGLNYSGIRRSLEVFLLKYQNTEAAKIQDAIQELSIIAADLRRLAKKSPGVPRRIWDRSEMRQTLQRTSPGITGGTDSGVTEDGVDLDG